VSDVHTKITVPPMLKERLERLVERYAEAHDCDPGEVRRIVEVGILTRGMSALEKTLA
jgi:hypothetical protein